MNSYNGFSSAERTAHYAVYKKMIAAGQVVWPTVCEACGQTEGRIEPHDEDYTVQASFGVCYRCHMMIHCRFKNRSAWNFYRDMARIGKRAEPLHGRAWGAVVRQLNGGAVTFTRHQPPGRQLLDEIDSGKWLNRGQQGLAPDDPALLF